MMYSVFFVVLKKAKMYLTIVWFNMLDAKNTIQVQVLTVPGTRCKVQLENKRYQAAFLNVINHK